MMARETTGIAHIVKHDYGYTLYTLPRGFTVPGRHIDWKDIHEIHETVRKDLSYTVFVDSLDIFWHEVSRRRVSDGLPEIDLGDRLIFGIPDSEQDQIVDRLGAINILYRKRSYTPRAQLDQLAQEIDEQRKWFVCWGLPLVETNYGFDLENFFGDEEEEINTPPYDDEEWYEEYEEEDYAQMWQ